MPVGILVALALAGVVYFAMRRFFSFKGKTRASGALMTGDADQINVRSADNVRLLSDEQLKALEESVEED